MVVDLDANSIQDWSGGPVTSVSGPTLELLPLLQRMTVLPLLKFGTVDPVALHSAVSTTFRGFALAMFGRYRLYMHPPEDDADEGGGGSGKKTVLLSHFYIKMLILPRHARDKHIENLKNRPFSCRGEGNF